MLFATTLASATTSRREVNVVDLVANSELILRGTVMNLTDGIDNRGIPYTEVTLHVADAIRGQVSGDYTFRQFGLLKPRDMGNGQTNLMVTPAGWATYTKGEETILFLNKKAAWTGLQTTVGLGQGKFKVSMAGATNQSNNAGLFKNVTIDPTLLGTKEQRAMMTQQGPVNANAFVGLVKQAVNGQWVETGRMNMTRNKLAVAALLLASLFRADVVAFAGGPLLVDPATKTAYHYDTSATRARLLRPGQPGRCLRLVHGNCRSTVTFDNSVGKHLVTKGYGDWSAIKTASMRANVVGDFSLIGLPDIDSTNVTDIIGTSNGRGIYVIFDADGSIMQNFFGAGDGVLGISSPQFAITGTTIITESFVVLNGSAIDPADTNAMNFQGVATHEFGHSLGMAHTQTNGAAYFYSQFTGEKVGPQSCTNLPYTTNLTSADVETMYPYIDPNVGGTGLAQANLHTTDTLASFSDLYPGPGWSSSYGTITGKVYDLDGKTELTGVNVIARNMADPFVDSTSAITGQMTQGQTGPDGSYTLHGLKPGAQVCGLRGCPRLRRILYSPDVVPAGGGTLLAGSAGQLLLQPMQLHGDHGQSGEGDDGQHHVRSDTGRAQALSARLCGLRQWPQWRWFDRGGRLWWPRRTGLPMDRQERRRLHERSQHRR